MNINTVSNSQVEHKRNDNTNHTEKSVTDSQKVLQNAKQLTETLVLEQLVNVDISSISKSQELLFRRVVEKLDGILEAKQGKGATQKALDAGFDFSPKAVAQSISSHASNLIASFQSKHQLEKGDPKLQDFVNLIQTSITSGFEEAKKVLSGFEVFKGDVEKAFNNTLTEVNKNMNTIRTALGLELIVQAKTESTSVSQDQTNNKAQ